MQSKETSISFPPPRSNRRPPLPSLKFLFKNRRFGSSSNPLLLLEKAARTYGDVVRVPVAGGLGVVITDPVDAERVLLTNARNYTKDWALRTHKEIFGEGLLTAEGEHWRKQRRMIQPAFQKERLFHYGKDMVAITERWGASWKEGAEFDVQVEMARMTLEIAMKTLFNMDNILEVGQTADALAKSLRHFARVISIPVKWPNWLPVKVNREYRESIVTFDAMIAKILEERRKSEVEGRDLLSMLLAVRDEAGNPMPPKQLRDELITLLLAGHETTAQAMTYTWYLLCRNPRTLEKLRAELDTVLGGRTPVPADLANLPYLENVVKESLRLYPPASVIGRESIDYDELGGYTIKPGTTVLMSPWVYHRDARRFEDPLAFKPERWEDGLEKRLPRVAYFPFGAGQRMCVGVHFALMEIALILATLVPKLHFETLSPEEIQIQVAVTIRVKGGLKMRVVRREKK